MDSMGDEPGEMESLPTVFLGVGRTAVAVSCGFSHTCVILDTGGLKCFGSAMEGQLGYDSMFNMGDNPGEMASLPTVFLGVGRTAVSVSCGGSNTCVILDNAVLKCFGYNWYAVHCFSRPLATHVPFRSAWPALLIL